MQFEPPPKDEANRDVRGEPSPPTSPPNEEGASCWLCFEEGSDESGQPLRRDCSCRGNDAGFAHLSCIVGYAKHKTENCDGQDVIEFYRPWEECPRCLQRYQNTLAVELVSEFVAFVEENYPSDQHKLLAALHLKMWVLIAHQHSDEAKEAGHKALSLVDQMKTASHLLPLTVVVTEANTYNYLGNICLQEGTKESAEAALEHFERFRDLSCELGDSVDVCHEENALVVIAENNIALAKLRYDGEEVSQTEGTLEKHQKLYAQCVERSQEGDSDVIAHGLILATWLCRAHRVIEIERLLAKLIATCKRVHGPNHSLTKKVSRSLQIYKQRWVKIVPGSDEVFLAVSYEDRKEMLTVYGPISKPRDTNAEKVHFVTSKDTLPRLGTPVVCRGLIDDKTHLNGKVGDVRSFDESCGCYHIYFEDKDLEPCLVKPENLRILFELPDE